MTELTTNFAFKLIEQQFAYAKQISDIFVPQTRSSAALAKPGNEKSSAEPVSPAETQAPGATVELVDLTQSVEPLASAEFTGQPVADMQTAAVEAVIAAESAVEIADVAADTVESATGAASEIAGGLATAAVAHSGLPVAEPALDDVPVVEAVLAQAAAADAAPASEPIVKKLATVKFESPVIKAPPPQEIKRSVTPASSANKALNRPVESNGRRGTPKRKK